MHGAEREKSAEERAVLEQLRGICLRLPEVVEAIDGFGHTSFRVRNKPLVMMGSQDLLIRSGRFRRTPYIGQHGWADVADFGNMDWDEIEALIVDAYRRVAPKRLLKQLP